MSSISQQKQNRMDKKVIPHLKRAIKYLNQKAFDWSERELTLAVNNYQRENIKILELGRQFAGIFNNMGRNQMVVNSANVSVDVPS